MNLLFTIAQYTPPRMRGIQEHFHEGGGSLTADFLRIVGVVLGGMALAYIIFSVINRRRQQDTNSPHALFNEVVRQLPLSIPQRDLLRRIAAGLHLTHPTVLLLSPQIFNTYANRWMSSSRTANRLTRKRIDDVMNILFPKTDTAHP